MRADLAPLREREFRLFFAGRAISLLGGSIAPVALAFAVLDLTGSKTDLGPGRGGYPPDSRAMRRSGTSRFSRPSTAGPRRSSSPLRPESSRRRFRLRSFSRQTRKGAILTAQAAGLVVGGLVGLRYRPRRMLVVATLAIMPMPAPLVALGFPLGVAWIAALGFLSGFGIEIFSLLWHTTVQQEVPPAKLSRVYSYDALGSLALVPLGLAAAGPIANQIGVRATLWGAAAIGAAVTVAVLFVTEVRTLERRVATSTP